MLINSHSNTCLLLKIITQPRIYSNSNCRTRPLGEILFTYLEISNQNNAKLYLKSTVKKAHLALYWIISYSAGGTFAYYSYWDSSYTNVMEENKNINIVSIWISASNYCISDVSVMSVCLYYYIYSCVVSILLMDDIAILGGKWYSHLSFTQCNENLKEMAK